MNYSEMSDFEINREVACRVGGFLARDILEEEQTIFKYHAGSTYTIFDPCNSWADAGPIIGKNCIGIMPFQNKPAKAWATSVGLLSNMYAEHENPLRAAMIVFLMMQGKSNA